MTPRLAASREIGDQGDARSLAVAGDRVIHTELGEECRGRNAERGATSDHSGARRCETQCVKRRRGVRCVMPERDRIAVVDIAHGHPDDVGTKVARRARGPGGCVAREHEIGDADVVPGVGEGGRHARHPVGENRIRGTLAICADEKHARPVRANGHSTHRNLAYWSGPTVSTSPLIEYENVAVPVSGAM